MTLLAYIVEFVGLVAAVSLIVVGKDLRRSSLIISGIIVALVVVVGWFMTALR